jgi:YHS domain-containing protein
LESGFDRGGISRGFPAYADSRTAFAQLTCQSYHGVTYQFASKEDQTTFQANPEKYVPKFGGFCAFATSVGVEADADPHEFAVSDGKLYVNNNEQAQKLFQQDVARNIEKANHNWPDVAKLPMR